MSLVDRLAARLPSLDARLRRPELARIAARIGSEDQLVREALRWLAEGDEQIAALEGAFDAVVAAAHARRGRPAIRAWIRAAHDRPPRRGDRGATRRRLGVEVVRERTTSAVEAIGIREELLLRLLVGRVSSEGPAPSAVIGRLLRARRWQTRLAAANVLEAWAAGGGDGRELVPTLVARAHATREHAWVRDACDAVLVRLDAALAAQILVEGLGDRGEDEFLLRRLRVERLAATWPAQVREHLALVPLDPSDHVRIGLAAALVRVGTADAVELLAELAERRSWRVRLAVVEYSARAASELPAELLSRVLAALLPVEEHPAVRRGLARLAARAATVFPGNAIPIRQLLDEAIAREGSEDRGGEALAAARRTCLRLADPVAMVLYNALLPLVPTLRPGTDRRISWAALGLRERPSDDQLGHVLAELARDDYGLWADPGPAEMTLGRGERFGFRAWRAVHELRSLAPNKRQSFDHTVGRRLRGAIRAPAARMAEVTATTVPGERTVVDREGSWVPALPSVDDALDVGEGTRIYSAWGVTRVEPPPSLLHRWLARARLVLRYPALARLRAASLLADEASERAAFTRGLRDELGIEVRFTLDPPAPARISQLTGSASVAGLLAWAAEVGDAILAPTRTSQPALALFASGVLGAMLARGYAQRERIRAARRAIPLVIGGWGTRGKSGTERIKAGLLHGLGHSVFVKTTGCEAMFICARPGLTAREVFIFRPQDKATIWEQAAMVEQAAGMSARVMLWECMALRPRFVELLQHQWMQDDLVTLTNAFPDHEDVQGPAGHDIATVISSFVPLRSVALTSEVEFLPRFRERARERGTELEGIDPVEADLLGEDLLARFPYQEHPRNIALVARMAERLGLDRNLAIATMADHVVPDLGVLRIYPTVRVSGRDVRFINGMSANERTGCVANWRRTGCDQIAVDAEPEHAIVVVVNNRADRVARSEVFARIMVQDLSADAYVLIGTNLTGLIGYVERALEAFLAEMQVRPEGMTVAQAEARVAGWFRRLRVGEPSVATLIRRAEIGALACGRTWAPTPLLERALAAQLNGDGPLDYPAALAALEADGALRDAFDAAAETAGTLPAGAEVVAAPNLGAVWTSWLAAVARQVLHARAVALLRRDALDTAAFRALFRDLFLRSLQPIHDRKASGDQIIVTVAGSVQPGMKVTCMGVQNIKGTGLDFAYRWVALGTVAPLVRRARAPEPDGRAEALRGLLAFDDYGLVDSGAARHALAGPAPGEDAEEAALRERVLARVAEEHDARVAALSVARTRRWWMPVVDWVEAILDPIDAIFRAGRAARTMRELRDHTISLGDAADTMQSLYDRQKGGWLLETIDGWFAKS